MIKGFMYAVDPGKKSSAVACFKDGEFIGVWFADPAGMDIKPGHVGEVAMEMPRAYPGSPVRENDLLDLAAAGMAVASKLGKPLTRIQLIFPADWKGTVPKPICQKRIERKLTQGELIRLGQCLAPVKASIRHNLYDAVGIGLYALKRAKKGIQ